MEPSLKVKVECKGADMVPIELLTEFQGNLKSLSEENYGKLKADILELGFSEPVSVWVNKKKNFILNGHQRLRVLKRMKDEGIEIPDIPINYVKAEDIKTAKKKVLALASQFGRVDSQGLYEFISENHISIEELEQFVHFPEVDLAHFKAEFFDGWSSDHGDVDKLPEDSSELPEVIKVICPASRKDECISLIKGGFVGTDLAELVTIE